jgi:methylmalonyl-CoA mutase N-terminal domain/subunit
VPILYIDERAAETQLGRLEEVRKIARSGTGRSGARGAQGGRRGVENTMPRLIECVRAYATVGEMCDALRQVWGEYEEVPSI